MEEFSRACQELLRPLRDDCALPNRFEIFSEALDGIRRNLHFDHLCLGFFDPPTDMLKFIVQVGGEAMPTEIKIHPDSLEVVVRGRLPIEVSDIDIGDQFPMLRELARSKGFRSFRVVPLRSDRLALGAICVHRREPGRFSAADVNYLDHAVRLVAVTLENVVMADVLKREKGRVETLLNVNLALNSSLDLSQVFKEVSELVRRVVDQDYTCLSIYDKGQDAMSLYAFDSGGNPDPFARGTLVSASECPAGVSHDRGEVLQFGRADLEQIGSEYTRTILAAGIRTVACFPLISHGRKLGSLTLASKSDNKPSGNDFAFLNQVANQVALAVDNSRAYEEIAKLNNRLSKEKLYLEEEICAEHNFGEIVGQSLPLRGVLKQVEIAAPSDATVLVLGETGTGKELIARAIHRLSSRNEGNFIKLNCAAIPTGLLESELFGHEKGAFTGAVSQKIGRLELADKGTLFLDEIGEIPLELQPKLLRVLQDHEFERLGGVRTIKVNVRVIAATNRDLAQAVGSYEFRSDLYYRLNVFPIRLPALRDRVGDIPVLVRYFVQKFARRMGKNIESIPGEIIHELEQWHWPGNIRELENFLERSVILTQGAALFAPMAELRVALPERAKSFDTLESFEREHILRTLRKSGGVISGIRGAAARLGMKRTTLQSRMQKLGITREEYLT